MPIQQQELIRVCEILSEQEGLKVTMNESLKGACIAFAGAFVGGVLGGPLGLGVGGAAGGALAAYKSRGKFKPAAYVIMYEMSNRDKQKLAEGVQRIVNNIDATDVVTLVAMINANTMIKGMVLDLIRNALTGQMGLTLV